MKSVLEVIEKEIEGLRKELADLQAATPRTEPEYRKPCNTEIFDSRGKLKKVIKNHYYKWHSEYKEERCVRCRARRLRSARKGPRYKAGRYITARETEVLRRIQQLESFAEVERKESACATA